MDNSKIEEYKRYKKKIETSNILRRAFILTITLVYNIVFHVALGKLTEVYSIKFLLNVSVLSSNTFPSQLCFLLFVLSCIFYHF